MTTVDEISVLLYSTNPEFALVVNRLRMAIEELTLNITDGYERYSNEDEDLVKRIIKHVNSGEVGVKDACDIYCATLSNKTFEYLHNLGVNMVGNKPIEIINIAYVVETLNDIVNFNYDNDDSIADITLNSELNNIEKFSRLVALLKPVEPTEIMEIMDSVEDRTIELLTKTISDNDAKARVEAIDNDINEALIKDSKNNNSILLKNYVDGFYANATIEEPLAMFNQNIDFLMSTYSPSVVDYLANNENIAIDIFFCIIIYFKSNIKGIKECLEHLDDTLEYANVKLTSMKIPFNKEEIISRVKSLIKEKIIKDG